MDSIRIYFNRFITLTNDEWSDFEVCLKKEIVEKKRLILKEEEKCDFLAFIGEGMFRFYYIKDGEEKITAFFFAGDFVSNYRSFLTGQPSDHYIESMQESVIYKIEKRNLQALYDKHKNIERLGRFIAENLYLGVASRLDSFLFDSPKQRYEALIRRDSKLLQEIPQYMLASYLGVKPETLSRIRARK
jgi:CRP/FNR family transcriptional regulator, anaerobic regulatory protein